MLSRFVISQVKHNSYFLVGLGIGLWLALAAVPLEEEVAACAAAALGPDEFEPQREERPLGPAGQAGRSVQRPRYYSTELGMRGGLLAGVLSSEAALSGRAGALNRTAARLLPALRFFITASALQAAPGRANVVGFTDTREMLKPFHALKYLADNYLEEYDFFFLVSDASFVNARRLSELVARLSVSQDIYMGTVADDDTHYCTLEGGILLSNSVLRAVHGELDWCVRNSYSPHHHENLGRCVLHAAHLRCHDTAQGENYSSLRLPEGEEGEGLLSPALADAVTAHPMPEPERFYQLHAYVSRVHLERVQAEAQRTRARAALSARKHPRGFRNASWPPALRHDAGLAPPVPPTRFDHLRWTRFNATHALMPDDHRAVGALSAAYKQAIDLIVEEATAWAAARWAPPGGGRGAARLVEGAWLWEPPRALRYRLLLRLPHPEGAGGESGGEGVLRQLEAARALGAARLAPARYVTESARVWLLLAVAGPHAGRVPPALRRLRDPALVVIVPTSTELSPAESAAVSAVREAARALPNAEVLVAPPVAPLPPAPLTEGELQRVAALGALGAALPKLPRDALVLLATPDMEFTDDFLNRVRMNTIAGEQWYQPLWFARHAQYAHPAFRDADGARPALNTGRFAAPRAPVVAFYKQDYLDALEAWRAAGGAEPAEPAAVLAAAPLRALRAPEPALLLPPRGAPCVPPAGAPPDARESCLKRERDRGFSDLQLGARHTLAKLLLQTQAELA